MTTKTFTFKNLEISIKFLSEVEGEINLKDTASGASENYSWTAFQKRSNGKLVTRIPGRLKGDLIKSAVQSKISKVIETHWEKIVNGLSDNFEEKTESIKSITIKLVTEYNDLDSKIKLSYIELSQSPKDANTYQLREHIDALQIQKDTILDLAPVLGISADDWSFIDHEIRYNSLETA